jgi:hypothetical protein
VDDSAVGRGGDINLEEEEAMRITSLVAILCAGLMGLALTLAAPQAEANGCVVDADCDDGLFCNGFEYCDSGTCNTTIPPCPQICIEQAERCVAGRITICHWVGHGNEKTLSIGVGAIGAHIGHGDMLGPCP